MDLLEAAMKADNLQLDIDDVECPDQSAIVIEENFLTVTDDNEAADFCDTEIEVTTPVVQGVTDLCVSEVMEEGQPCSNIGYEEIIPVVSGNKDKIDLHRSVMAENVPMVTANRVKTDFGELSQQAIVRCITKRPVYQRKVPNKKPLRKRFNRPKRYAERQKRLRALKALTANPEFNEVNPFVVTGGSISQFDHTDKFEDKVFQSDQSGGLEDELPFMTIIKGEPHSSIVNTISTSQLSVKNSQDHVRKMIFKRDTHRPGVILGTPINIKNSTSITVSPSQAQSPTSKHPGVQNLKIHPIHKLKSVFMKCFRKPVSSSSQRSSVRNFQHPIAKIHAGNPIFQQSISEDITLTPDLHSVSVKSDNAAYFIDESTSFESASEVPSSKAEQRGVYCESIPTSAIAHITQPGSFPEEPDMAPPRNTLIVTPLGQSEYIPTTSLPFSIPVLGVVQQANVQPTEQLLESVGKTLVEMTPPPWITVLKHNGIALCLLSHSNIITIQRSLLVEANGNVTAAVHGKELPPDNPFWQHVKPVELRSDTVKQFITHIEQLLCRLRGMEVCKAVEDFEPFWKTAINCEVDLNRFHELRFSKCCRSQSCHLLVSGLHYKRCNECSKVWKLLSRRALVDSKKPGTLSLRKPFKYLTSPEKRERFDMAVREIRRLKRANKGLNEKLKFASEDAEDSPVNSVLPQEADYEDPYESDFEWPETEDLAS